MEAVRIAASTLPQVLVPPSDILDTLAEPAPPLYQDAQLDPNEVLATEWRPADWVQRRRPAALRAAGWSTLLADLETRRR